MSRVFLSFASSDYRTSLRRIERQAKRVALFDRVICADETYLDSDFRDGFRDLMVKGTPGYGYWCWKPQIILQTLRDMKPGDVLLYCDAGCHINANGLPRLKEYFEFASQSPSGIVAFKSGIPTPELPCPRDDQYEIDLPSVDVRRKWKLLKNYPVHARRDKKHNYWNRKKRQIRRTLAKIGL